MACATFPLERPRISALSKNVSTLESLSKKFENNWGLQEVNVAPDVRFSLDFGRNLNIGDLQISTINAISYSNTNQVNEVAFNRYMNYNADRTSGISL